MSVHFIFFLLSLSSLLHAQQRGSITGTVVLDSTSDPLHHVTILVIPLGRTVQTNNEGVFRIDNVPPGKYELLAHMHALSDERRSVEVTAGGTAQIEFRLKVAVVREQVTVTASGKEETTLESFLSATSLDTTDLTSQTATSLGEVLEHQAGVAKRSSGPGSSRPVIRGFDGDRVLILQDGVRTGTLSSTSGDHGEPVDANAIERVEVVRGPATLLYEGNALGGVVNVITGHHQIHKEPHDGLRGFLTGLMGSNNFRRGSSGGFEYGLKRWILFGNGGTVYLDDYHSSLGPVPNSRSDVTDGSFGAGRYGEKLFFNLSYAHQDGAYGIPFDPGQKEHEIVTLPFRRHNLRFNGGARNLDRFFDQFQISLNYSDWKHEEMEGGQIANRFFNKQFIYRAVFDHKRVGKLTGSAGFWGMTRDYKSIGTEALTPPVNQNAFAAFGVEQWSFQRLRLQFGARVEHSGYDATQKRSRGFTGVAASVGANVPLWHGGAFVANFTSSFRAPALEELYAFGPHAGNLTFEIGDENLSRERGNGFDLSLRHTSARFRAEGNLFYYRMSDFVFLAPTGEIRDELPVGNYRQGTSRYRGAEARLSAGVRNDLWLHVSVDAVNAALVSPSKPLPRIPPVRGHVGVELHKSSFSLMPELVLTNKQGSVYELETPTAGYAALNLKALYSVTTKHFLHLFGFNLFNASDRLYRNHLSFIKAFAPEIGRGVLFTYTVRFF
ncbi:MAG: TonB-dependent receptor [Acidobacteria bacterium]|nr:TonB-dependent receptor [Acidobacteriota bacterium]